MKRTLICFLIGLSLYADSAVAQLNIDPAHIQIEGISQEKLPIYLAFFQFTHNARKRGKALLESLISSLVSSPPRITV